MFGAIIIAHMFLNYMKYIKHILKNFQLNNKNMKSVRYLNILLP